MMTSWRLQSVFQVKILVFKNINPKPQRLPAQPNLPPWFWFTPASNPSIRKSCLGNSRPDYVICFLKTPLNWNLKCIPGVKEASLKGLHTVGFQLYNTLKNAKLWRQLKNQWLPGGRGRQGYRGKTQRCLGQRNYFVWIIMVDTCHYTFVKTHRKHSPNVNQGCWVIMMCQARFISCKCTDGLMSCGLF